MPSGLPQADPSAPAPSSTITGSIQNIKKFIEEPLAQKKDELEKIIVNLEDAISDILLPKKGDEAKSFTSELKNMEKAPSSVVHGLLVDVHDDVKDFHEFLERVRNKISGIIDRVHLK